ncbi:Cytochrome P450 714C2 [Vitis vinifera]|uniref:Cytochrome P450 714C2 n=1 Tax=Vitis vinifera TaxID=29760 RepID=A0A438GZW7_VITVI|nr:Cytochrome P450 714C2 [Vitis vinifera]
MGSRPNKSQFRRVPCPTLQYHHPLHLVSRWSYYLEDFDGALVASLLTKFRMPEIERYEGIGLMVILGLFFCLCNALVVKLEKLRSIVRKQGISGPPLSFLLGEVFMFSGDVTSRACFESSYTKGEEIFWRLGALQKAMSKKKYSVIPGYIPTKNYRDAWALEKDVHNLIIKMLDNCKNIYLASYKTTTVFAGLCLILLGANPNWQSRLYPPVLMVLREALIDMKFGDIHVGEGGLPSTCPFSNPSSLIV